MQDELDLRLSQEEAFLLLTGARLFDKLVAGVTIHSEQRDELIQEIIEKLANSVSRQMDSMSDELADVIVESVLGSCDPDCEQDCDLDCDINCDIGCSHDYDLSYEPLDEQHDKFLFPGYDLDSETYKQLQDQALKGLFGDKQLRIEGLGLDCKPDHISASADSDLGLPGSNKSKNSRINPEKAGISYGSFHRSLELAMIDDSFSYPMYTVEEKLPVLEKAIAENRSLRINYYSLERETVDDLTLEPLAMLQENGKWLAVAHCLEKKEIFIFRIDRIKNLEETGAIFDSPEELEKLRCKALSVYK